MWLSAIHISFKRCNSFIYPYIYVKLIFNIISNMQRKPSLGFWQIWNMSFGFFGIQFGFALQNANVSRIFETLGASMDNIPILWIAAPVTGWLYSLSLVTWVIIPGTDWKKEALFSYRSHSGFYCLTDHAKFSFSVDCCRNALDNGCIH